MAMFRIVEPLKALKSWNAKKNTELLVLHMYVRIVVHTSGITDWSISENMEMLKAVELCKLLGAVCVPTILQ